MSKFVNVNGIKIHYLDHPGGAPTLILLPGLTANAHSFDGLVAAGLSPRFRALAVDFRGRGRSDKPDSGYSMNAYAADILALLDELQLEKAVICGHSFGALIGFVLAAQNPERFEKLAIIDSSHLLISERTVKLIKSSLDRLGQKLPSMTAYMAAMKQMPFLNGYWDDALESFYRHDMRRNEDGTVQAQTRPDIIAETIDYQFAEPWAEHVAAIKQPVLLLNATAPYGPPGAPPILTEEMARETAVLFANCAYQQISGNHVTLLFGENAKHTADAITKFVVAA